MMDFDTERHIGETMALVLRERLVELETVEAAGGATEDTVSRLALVRKTLVRFDARDNARHQVRAGGPGGRLNPGPSSMGWR